MKWWVCLTKAALDFKGVKKQDNFLVVGLLFFLFFFKLLEQHRYSNQSWKTKEES